MIPQTHMREALMAGGHLARSFGSPPGELQDELLGYWGKAVPPSGCNHSPSEKESMACDGALVETERFTMDHQATTSLGLPTTSQVLPDPLSQNAACARQAPSSVEGVSVRFDPSRP